jgi:hypothetical protein
MHSRGAAHHYARVMELVEQYVGEMRLKYLRVRYEDMVDHQEASIRRVLDFIGEEFDLKCLAFHENRRCARTASYAQVTEKLYDRSRYRYRNYLPQLQPVIPILQPVVQFPPHGLRLKTCVLPQQRLDLRPNFCERIDSCPPCVRRLRLRWRSARAHVFTRRTLAHPGSCRCSHLHNPLL